MSAVTFDTLKYVERLKLAGVSDEQAKAEVEALAEALNETIAIRDLATKKDIKDLELAVKQDMGQLRVDMEATKAELIKWMAGLLLAQAALIAALVKLMPP
jgi:Protein of unknown function (DUF1640)